MQKILFLDRDGTLVIEPPEDYQLDSLEKLEFYPRVFQYLSRIVTETDYRLVMVTNQDGLGTSAFPEADFYPAHNKIIQAFKNEGIEFSEVLIDRTFEHENADTRKPGTAMLRHYMNGNYDLENSYVLGDRISDIQLAKNLGAKGIFIHSDPETVSKAGLENTCVLITENWEDIYRFLKLENRTAKIKRKTRETDIVIDLELDGQGKAVISTGLGFFDHMLEQIARHSGCNLKVVTKGDLEIDEHHTIEDTALALGKAFYQALGSKRGIERYGYCLPMDDCLAQVAIDFGGRNWLEWNADFNREMIGKMPTEMFFHFFKSFTDTARCNLNIKAEGNNEHHKIEAIFKAFARAIKMAVRRDLSYNELPTTKGVL